MLLCSLPPSQVTIAADVPAVYRSVQYFDNLSHVTQRALDRSVCKVILSDTPVTAPNGTVYNQPLIDALRATYQRAVAQHCQLRLSVDHKLNAAGECGEGFSKTGLVR